LLCQEWFRTLAKTRRSAGIHSSSLSCAAWSSDSTTSKPFFFGFSLPVWIQEWNVDAATLGLIATVANWVGLIGILGVPILVDLYGRKPTFAWSTFGYATLTALNGFAQNAVPQVLILRSLVRIPLNGASAIGFLIVAETMPTRLRSLLLSGLNGVYPPAYVVAAALAGFVIPNYGWRTLYFMGIVPALLIFVIRAKVHETPAFTHVQEQRALSGKSARPDLITPFKKYPRQMVIGFVMYTLYVFTWTGYSTWLPTWLVKDYGLDFATAAFIFMVQASYGAGASAFVRELFPAKIRGTAAGAIALSSGFVSALAPGIMGILISNGTSIGASFIVPGIAFLLIGPVFYLFAPETVGVKIPDLVEEGAPVAVATPLPQAQSGA
jgi:MFS family permease